jgi:hypothetical protein
MKLLNSFFMMYSLNGFLRKPSGHEKFISYCYVVVSGIGCKPFGIDSQAGRYMQVYGVNLHIHPSGNADLLVIPAQGASSDLI